MQFNLHHLVVHHRLSKSVESPHVRAEQLLAMLSDQYHMFYSSDQHHDKLDMRPHKYVL